MAGRAARWQVLTAVQQHAHDQTGEGGEAHGVVGFVLHQLVGLAGGLFHALGSHFFKIAQFALGGLQFALQLAAQLLGFFAAFFNAAVVQLFHIVEHGAHFLQELFFLLVKIFTHVFIS